MVISTSIEPKTLSAFLNSKKKIILSITKLHHFHIITFFADLILSSVLEHLQFESQDITIVPPSILCMTIKKLKSVKLINVKMTNSQKRAIRTKFPKKCSSILISQKSNQIRLKLRNSPEN